jgi:hypothetical protein
MIDKIDAMRLNIYTPATIYLIEEEEKKQASFWSSKSKRVGIEPSRIDSDSVILRQSQYD